MNKAILGLLFFLVFVVIFVVSVLWKDGRTVYLQTRDNSVYSVTLEYDYSIRNEAKLKTNPIEHVGVIILGAILRCSILFVGYFGAKRIVGGDY